MTDVPKEPFAKWLLGCAAVFVISLLLVFICPPSIDSWIVRHKVESMRLMNAGRNTYVCIFAAEMEDSRRVWPIKGPLDTSERVFPNSTEYPRWIVTNGIINTDFGFWMEDGAKSKLLDPATFTVSENIWAVVSEVSSNMPDGTPVLFTRNFTQKGGEPLEHIGQEPFLDGGTLKGKVAGVVVFHGGRTEVFARTP